MPIIHLNQSLEGRITDRDLYGAKFVGLVETYPYLKGNKDMIVPPGFFVPEEMMNAPQIHRAELRDAYNQLVEGRATPILVWARSNANVELDGVFDTVPTMYDPDDPNRSFEDFVSALQKVAESKHTERAKREVESFGLEGKLRLHGLVQVGGAFKPNSEAFDFYCPHLVQPRALLGAYSVAMYAYSHSPFNPKYMEIRFGFGLGSGIVEGVSNLLEIGKDGEISMDLSWDGRESTKQEWLQRYAQVFEPTLRQMKEVSLARLGLQYRHPDLWSGFRDISLMKIFTLLQVISSHEGPVKLEIVLPDIIDDPESILIVQKDSYKVNTPESTFEFSQPADASLVFHGEGICKQSERFRGDLIVTNYRDIPSIYEDSGKKTILNFLGKYAKKHAILSIPKQRKDYTPVGKNTIIAIEKESYDLHHVNLCQRRVYDGNLAMYVRFPKLEEKILELEPTHRPLPYLSIFENVLIECDGNKALLVMER